MQRLPELLRQCAEARCYEESQRYDEDWPTVMLKDFATSIVQTLRQHGFQAYLVGGCVRDLLLGREPKDYDVATECDAARGDENFPRDLCGGRAVWRRAGSAPDTSSAPSCEMEGTSKSDCVEVATFRSDIGYSRRPPSRRSALQQ